MSATTSLTTAEAKKPVYVYAATDEASGTELWVAGQDLSNPHLLKDLNPGAAGSNPSGFFTLRTGELLFFADDGVHGRELWKTDGTEAGTKLVRDVSVGEGTSGPEFLALKHDSVMLSLDDGVHGREVWISHGGFTDTWLWLDINEGPASSNPEQFVTLPNGNWLFTAETAENGREVWVSDGRQNGTHLLTDLSAEASSDARTILLSPNGHDAYITDGHLLWKTDGTAEGTALLGEGYLPLNNGKWIALGDKGISVYREYLITDGTPEGTINLNNEFGLFGPMKAVSFGDGRMLLAHSRGNFIVTDGTREGTHTFHEGAPIYSYGYPFSTYLSLGDGHILFTVGTGAMGIDGTGELWVTDGTDAGTYLLGDNSLPLPWSLSDSEDPLRLDDGSIILDGIAKDSGRLVWKTDLTPGSLELVEGITPSAETTFHEVMNKLAYGSVVISTDELIAGNTIGAAGVGVGDLDGWTNNRLYYRWYRENDDGGWDPQPLLATGNYNPSYKLTEADVGHRLKVEGYFIDKLGHQEHIFSAPSEVVKAAEPPTPPEPHQWSEQLSLFDITYYLTNNPDVSQSGMDPLQHFLQFGGTEGRSPNAEFDSAFYLSQNLDVASSGMNPFLHYLAYGWQEGRMASAKNDFQAAHPELGSPELTAAARSLLEANVQQTGPEAPPDNPSAVHSSDSLVDAQFYYETYQDVAQAGIDAYEHYMTFGWREGRDPDALFDTSYYLETNADVAAAGLNPLAHYLAFSAQEGRAPSAVFDGAAYLAHNPDVAAAGMNPLAHYLAYGLAEHRDIFAS